jgi:anti-anti-sigma factor
VEEALYYKDQDNVLYVRAVGHITAAVCYALRLRVFDRLGRTPEPDAFYIDLSQCSYMDSTFMGLLVGFNKQFRPGVEIVAPSEPCVQLLKGLGIHTLLRIRPAPVALPKDMELMSSASESRAEVLLKAHEHLIEISDENRKRFALLRSILKKKVDEEKPEQS